MPLLHGYRDKQDRPAALISDEVWEFVHSNAAEMDAAVEYQRDFDYDYFGFKTLEKSYLLRVHGRIVERPDEGLLRHPCL